MKPQTQTQESNILITGASGFLGRALSEVLSNATLLVRNKNDSLGPNQVVATITKSNVFNGIFTGIDKVIHCAARVHLMKDTSHDPYSEYLETNCDAALNFASQAAACGVKRFIFVSTVKVHGETTRIGHKFSELDEPKACDYYAKSKLECERGLLRIGKDTGMEITIIRPPLVYGPKVKANFAVMMNLARKGLPLPLGAINNKRSLVALDNLVDLIITCIEHPNAANQTFLVSDDHDVSTTELLKMMTRAVGKKPMLLPVPVSWLRLAGKLVGKQAVIDRLCGNLQVDISHTKNILGWQPPITVEEGIQRCFVEEEST